METNSQITTGKLLHQKHAVQEHTVLQHNFYLSSSGLVIVAEILWSTTLRFQLLGSHIIEQDELKIS